MGPILFEWVCLVGKEVVLGLTEGFVPVLRPLGKSWLSVIQAIKIK